MPDDFKIPRATLKRLPLYYRLVSILKGKGIDRVNSKTISEALQIDSATIRRDFSYFGELGNCLLYTSPSPRDKRQSRMPSSA